MPGDPVEYRARARRGADLANGSASPITREAFADMAESWLKLAADTERTLAFLESLDGIRPKRPAKRPR